jgi:hypothetical protein
MIPTTYTVSLNNAKKELDSIKIHKDSRVVTRWYDKTTGETRNNSNHQLSTTKTFVKDLITARTADKSSKKWEDAFFNNYHQDTGKYGAGHARKFKDSDDVWLEINIFEPFDYIKDAAKLDAKIQRSIKDTSVQTDVVFEATTNKVSVLPGKANLVMVGKGAKNIHITKQRRAA